MLQIALVTLKSAGEPKTCIGSLIRSGGANYLAPIPELVPVIPVHTHYDFSKLFPG
jgi:hypothetical protein